MGTGVGEAMLIGAVTGAGTSAVTGGDPLKGALLGAAGGGFGAGIAGAGTGAASGTAAGTTTGTAAGTATGTAAGTTTGTAAGTTGLQFATPAEFDALMNATQTDPFLTSLGDTGVATQTLGPSGLQELAQTPSAIMDPALSGTSGVPVATNTAFQPGTVASGTPAENPMFPNINKLYANNPTLFPAAAGMTTSAMFGGPKPFEEEEDDEYRGALSDFSYSRSGYTPYRAASGGLMDTAPARRLMGGGQLGSYSDGGQTLQGPGDGMSDSIPASIGGTQPARLADGEFVVPADVVSGIGNGSTDAGARQLYDMMDKIREARTGRTRQAPEINPRRMMPA